MGCQTNETNQSNDEINQLSKEELEIYNFFLKDKPKEIVVIDGSIIGGFGEIETGALKEILKGLQDDTFDNLVKMNAVPTKIKDYSTSNFDYTILDREEFEKRRLKLVVTTVFQE